MAGRVERRINDKFYFVLDEVGGSSDGETEATSDKDANSRSRLAKASDVKEENDSMDMYASKGNERNKIKDGNPSRMEINDSLIYNTSDSNSKPDERGNKMEISPRNDKPPEEEENGELIDSEETSAVVDMDVDSDVECSQPDVEPLLRITFRDESVEENLKSSLYKFLSQKIDNCTIITNSENSLELKVYNKDPAKLLRDDVLDFDLDTTPSNGHSSFLFYGRNHDFLLSDKNLEEQEEKKKTPASTTSCFNCLGNHNLRDCTEVKDFQTINQNRLKFQKANKSVKVSRYHLDENQKFSHILPGVISKKLRNALNLRRDQQPSFIYQMRILGYPPAWLEEAKVSHSGVAMYDNIGAPVLEEDEEEGEIIPEGSKDRFDITKIIEFPGFNVPLPNNFKDESKYYHCPAMSEDQSIGNLIKQLEPKTVQAYVKKSLSSQKLESKPSSQDDADILSSPTIEEMEEKKRQLLMELNDEDAASDARLNSEDSGSGTGAESETAQSAPGKELGSVKNSQYGTPILKSFSPFSKLPSREQFSVNVSDVINFENLPNSTGKYESMRNVITKIRASTSKKQEPTN